MAHYTEKTLAKFIGKSKELFSELKGKTESFDICISKGNKKIGHTLNVSLLPIFTCANCKECKEYCYDIKACLQHPKNVWENRVKNTIMAKENPQKYFDQIEKAIQRRKRNFIFRWHVSGDILNYEYLENMIRIAKKYPYFTFWTYTKNYSLVNLYVKNNGNSKKKAIPGNLSIMFSEWKGMPMENPYKFPVFTCIFPNEKPEKGFHKCSGNCNDCIVNGTGCVVGKSSFTNLH